MADALLRANGFSTCARGLTCICEKQKGPSRRRGKGEEEDEQARRGPAILAGKPQGKRPRDAVMEFGAAAAQHPAHRGHLGPFRDASVALAVWVPERASRVQAPTPHDRVPWVKR